jgi:hypothetical protein
VAADLLDLSFAARGSLRVAVALFGVGALRAHHVPIAPAGRPQVLSSGGGSAPTATVIT